VTESNAAHTVPETKQLTLEEMDIVFGSSGVAAADQERMAQINAEIGLDRANASGHESEEHVSEKVVESKQV